MRHILKLIRAYEKIRHTPKMKEVLVDKTLLEESIREINYLQYQIKLHEQHEKKLLKDLQFEKNKVYVLEEQVRKKK